MNPHIPKTTISKDAIIKVNDNLTVIVDKDDRIEKDNWYITAIGQIARCIEVLIYEIRGKLADGSTCRTPFNECYKIICTIGTQRLEGIPMIQYEGEVKYELAFLNSVIESKVTFGKEYIDGFKEGYKTREEKGVHSDEDLIEAFRAGKDYGETWALFNHTDSISRTEAEKCISEVEYIQSLNQPKQITEIELEMVDVGGEEWMGSNEDGQPFWNSIMKIKIHDNHTNTITPISVKYN